MTSIAQYVEIAKVLAPSLITAFAVAVAGGIAGVFVLLRREPLVALALPQMVTVGAAIGLRLGLQSTLAPAIGAVIISLLLLVWSKRRGAGNWLLPSLYIAGLSISFLIIANGGQHVAELQAIFTGIDVAVSVTTAQIAAPILIIASLLIAVLWRRWLLLAQAPSTAEVSGLDPARWDVAFLILLAIMLMFGTNALGTVMVIAMLFLPAATVLPWTRRIPATLAFSSICGVVFLAMALVLSVENDWPLSQTVGGVGFACLLLSHLTARLRGS